MIKKLNVKRLTKEAVLPNRAHSTDGGMDLTAVSRSVHKNYTEYGTGLAIEIPVGYVGLLFPRSSISNKNQSLCNAVGVVDHGFTGEVKLRFRSTAQDYIQSNDIYEIGERIGQLVLVPVELCEVNEVEELGQTERGEGGFGSTGS